MPRTQRIDYEGAWHHVMNRGARRAPVFNEDPQAGDFLHMVGATAERFDLEVHGYAVMPNHYHLLVRSVRGNLSHAMRYLGARFTQDLNRRSRWDGPVFRGRFRNQVIGDEGHLLTVISYLHLNPLRAGIVKRLDQHCWTSHRAYLGLDVPPEWLNRDFILALAGGEEAFSEMVAGLRRGRLTWPEELDAGTGWLKTEASIATRRATRRNNITDRSLPKHEPSSDEVLGRVMDWTGTDISELRQAKHGRGANPARRFAAWALAKSTQLTQAQIGALLDMTPGHIALTIRRFNTEARSVRNWVDAFREEFLKNM